VRQREQAAAAAAAAAQRGSESPGSSSGGGARKRRASPEEGEASPEEGEAPPGLAAKRQAVEGPSGRSTRPQSVLERSQAEIEEFRRLQALQAVEVAMKPSPSISDDGEDEEGSRGPSSAAGDDQPAGGSGASDDGLPSKSGRSAGRASRWAEASPSSPSGGDPETQQRGETAEEEEAAMRQLNEAERQELATGGEGGEEEGGAGAGEHLPDKWVAVPCCGRERCSGCLSVQASVRAVCCVLQFQTELVAAEFTSSRHTGHTGHRPHCSMVLLLLPSRHLGSAADLWHLHLHYPPRTCTCTTHHAPAPALPTTHLHLHYPPRTCTTHHAHPVLHQMQRSPTTSAAVYLPPTRITAVHPAGLST
jgi:hypothetical protein